MGLPGPASTSPRIHFDSPNLASNLTDYAYPTAAYTTTASPARPYTLPDGAGISPSGLYDLSAGEMSLDNASSGRCGDRGIGSVSSQGISYAATVSRTHHVDPMPTPASRRAPKRKQSRGIDNDDEDDDFQPTASAPTQDARLFANNASSLSRGEDTNLGKATPASVRLCPPRTKRQAKPLCSIAQRHTFGISTLFATSSRQDSMWPSLKSTGFGQSTKH